MPNKPSKMAGKKCRIIAVVLILLLFIVAPITIITLIVRSTKNNPLSIKNDQTKAPSTSTNTKNSNKPNETITASVTRKNAPASQPSSVVTQASGAKEHQVITGVPEQPGKAGEKEVQSNISQKPRNASPENHRERNTDDKKAPPKDTGRANLPSDTIKEKKSVKSKPSEKSVTHNDTEDTIKQEEESTKSDQKVSERIETVQKVVEDIEAAQSGNIQVKIRSTTELEGCLAVIVGESNAQYDYAAFFDSLLEGVEVSSQSEAIEKLKTAWDSKSEACRIPDWDTIMMKIKSKPQDMGNLAEFIKHARIKYLDLLHRNFLVVEINKDIEEDRPVDECYITDIEEWCNLDGRIFKPNHIYEEYEKCDIKTRMPDNLYEDYRDGVLDYFRKLPGLWEYVGGRFAGKWNPVYANMTKYNRAEIQQLFEGTVLKAGCLKPMIDQMVLIGLEYFHRLNIVRWRRRQSSDAANCTIKFEFPCVSDEYEFTLTKNRIWKQTDIRLGKVLSEREITMDSEAKMRKQVGEILLPYFTRQRIDLEQISAENEIESPPIGGDIYKSCIWTANKWVAAKLMENLVKCNEVQAVPLGVQTTGMQDCILNTKFPCQANGKVYNKQGKNNITG